MRHVIPSLFVCCLVSVAHAAPEAAQPLSCPPDKTLVQVKITEVLLSAEVPASFSLVKDPKTNAPNDLLALQQAAAKAKVTLIITPGFIVTTVDGTKGSLNMQTKYPYTVTDIHGKKEPAFQTLGNGVSALPNVNADGTITVQLSVTDTKETGPPATPDGPLPITTQAFSTIRTFANGQTKNIGGLGIQGHASHLVFATVTVVSPAKP